MENRVIERETAKKMNVPFSSHVTFTRRVPFGGHWHRLNESTREIVDIHKPSETKTENNWGRTDTYVRYDFQVEVALWSNFVGRGLHPDEQSECTFYLKD